jgi:hypothetical protein
MEPLPSSPANSHDRSRSPVFVLGSPRSGTTMLYDMLLSAGGFAVYLAESNVFNLLVPRFGDLRIKVNRQKLLDEWLRSKLYRATGLNKEEISKKILDGCQTGGDFLRAVMDEIARVQGVRRWAENSPEGMLHLSTIKRQIPDALFIHAIRDPRDVAMSLGKLKYVRPFPWEERQSLIGSGLYWQWILERGRGYGRTLGSDYMEVHFEDLLSSPQEMLNKIGSFLDHELDYERIRQVAYGSLTKPNTSFRTESPDEGFSPIGRWKKGFPPDQLFHFERMIGSTMQELGYVPATDGPAHGLTNGMKLTRMIYRNFFEAKLRAKSSALLRRIRPLTAERIDQIVLADDHAPILKTVVSHSS